MILDLAAGRSPDVTNPERFVELATRHGLVGIAARSDSSILSGLTIHRYSRLVARQGVMLSHTRRLLHLLDEAGVRTAILKGPAVALRYERPEVRTFTDIDLLIPRPDLQLAIEVLRSDPVVQGLPPQKPRADKRELLVQDSPSGIRFSIDLHWDAFSYTQLGGRARRATPEAWERAWRITDQLGPRWSLPLEAELAFLCAHAVWDHRFRLILFRDLAELIRAEPDWEALVEWFVRHGLRSTGYLAWLIAANALSAPVPREVLAQLRPKGVALRAADRLLPSTDLVLFDGHRPHPLNLAMVLIHDDPGQRARLVLRAPKASLHWRRRLRGHQPVEARRSLTLLVASTQRRGAEVFCERLAEALKAQRWDTSLLALAESPGPAVAARPLSRGGSRGKLNPATVVRLRRQLRTDKPQVLLAFGSSTLKYAVIATAFLPHRPRVAYASIGEPLYWARTWRQKATYRLLLKRVDLVLSVSERTSDQLRKVLGVPAKKLGITPTGVPRSLLEISRPSSDGEFHVLFVGSLSAEKDPLAALHVFAQVAAAHQARLRILGAGPLEETLTSQIRDLKLEGRVELLGSVEAIEPHLTWADMLLLTSRTEGLPAVILEAAAAAVAVIAYDVGGVGEAVIDGVTGRLITPGDAAELVTALAHYALNPDETRAAGEAGRRMVAARFTLEASAHRFDMALSRLAPLP